MLVWLWDETSEEDFKEINKSAVTCLLFLPKRGHTHFWPCVLNTWNDGTTQVEVFTCPFILRVFLEQYHKICQAQGAQTIRYL